MRYDSFIGYMVPEGEGLHVPVRTKTPLLY